MTKRIAVFTLTTAIAATVFTGTAMASSKAGCGNVPRADWMSEDQVRSKATDMGYKVRNVKMEDNCWEIYAIDSKGNRVEAYLHPVSGEVVQSKIDD